MAAMVFVVAAYRKLILSPIEEPSSSPSGFSLKTCSLLTLVSSKTRLRCSSSAAALFAAASAWCDAGRAVGRTVACRACFAAARLRAASLASTKKAHFSSPRLR